MDNKKTTIITKGRLFGKLPYIDKQDDKGNDNDIDNEGNYNDNESEALRQDEDMNELL